MSDWEVDPDGVLGVLAGLDQLAPAFTAAEKESTALVADGAAVLSVDGRTALSGAWSQLLAERALVPGELIWVLTRSASAVSAATVEVVLGDDEMASNARQAAQHAQDAWGILPLGVYQDPAV